MFGPKRRVRQGFSEIALGEHRQQAVDSDGQNKIENTFGTFTKPMIGV